MQHWVSRRREGGACPGGLELEGAAAEGTGPGWGWGGHAEDGTRLHPLASGTLPGLEL